MLLKVVQSGAMPPRGKLSNEQIQILTQWVQMKAPFGNVQTDAMSGGRMGRTARGPGGRGLGGPRAGVANGPSVGQQTPLSVFCQTLMASAGFRVLD